MDIQQLTALRGVTVPYKEQEPVRKAIDAMHVLAANKNMIFVPMLDLYSLQYNGSTVANCLPVYFDVASKVAVVPGNLVKPNDPKMYASVVCFDGDKPVDVLMFDSVMFAKKKKPVKFDKNNNQYLIKIKDIKDKKMQLYSFGVVVGQLQKKE